jgi:uncharacterized membrane protein HdeD (DUF308 family)
MSQTYTPPATTPRTAETSGLRGMWLCLLLCGIALIVAGFAALGSSLVATLATVVVAGILFLVGGGVHLVTAFYARRWRGFFLHLLAAVLYIIAGIWMLDEPLWAAVKLTLLFGICLVIGGLGRIIVSPIMRFPGWGWEFFNGVITGLLGMAIVLQWPFSGLAFIGIYVGIEMLISGISLVMLALGARAAPAA